MQRWQRRRAIQMLGVGLAAASANRLARAAEPCSSDHIAWVIEALKRIQTIHAEMTRTDLMSVFTTEGGLSTALRRTFVSRDCPFFKVDVTFRRAKERQPESGEGRFLLEYGDDVIAAISRPYLQFSIAD